MITLSCFLLLHTLGALGPAKCAELFIKLAIARKFRIKNVMEAPLLGQEEREVQKAVVSKIINAATDGAVG